MGLAEDMDGEFGRCATDYSRRPYFALDQANRIQRGSFVNSRELLVHLSFVTERIHRLFGMNLGGAEGGELWRRHRRIMGPAFNNKTCALFYRFA